ncbi:Wadjet anti-phage system protein JetD domain-containing protein [Bradyrhizobium sp. USDA 3311]
MVSEQTPIFHWSDIDPDGTWIFHTIERAVDRPIRPHLMSVEVAERLGQVPFKNRHPLDVHRTPGSQLWQPGQRWSQDTRAGRTRSSPARAS